MGELSIQKLVYIVLACIVISCFPLKLQAASIEITSSGLFANPALGSGGIANGIGTDFFSWDIGINGSPSSRLEFAGSALSVDFKEIFSLGSLTYFNGRIERDIAATAVDLVVTTTSTMPSGITEQSSQTLRLTITPNTDGPQASANIVFLPVTFPDFNFVVNGVEYTLTILGFGSVSGSGFTALDNFNVLEGDTASAELLARVGRACLVPVGAIPKKEPIVDIGTCGPKGQKTPTWGSFGKRPGGVLIADSGETLEVECSGSGDVPLFMMWYTSPEGDRTRVGVCPFEGGCNSKWFWHAGDNDNNNAPDCFMQTRWISKDYGSHDDRYPNPWTAVYEPNDKNVDWAEILFDANTTEFAKTAYKFEKLVDYPLPCPTLPMPEGKLVSTIMIDPLLEPETEEFFERRAEGLQPLLEGTPMGDDTSASCDFDGDKDCDEDDHAFFRTMIGICRGDSNYHPLADSDGDGCVTLEDESSLFGR